MVAPSCGRRRRHRIMLTVARSSRTGRRFCRLTDLAFLVSPVYRLTNCPYDRCTLLICDLFRRSEDTALATERRPRAVSSQRRVFVTCRRPLIARQFARTHITSHGTIDETARSGGTLPSAPSECMRQSCQADAGGLYLV